MQRLSPFRQWLKVQNAIALADRLDVTPATIGYWRRGTLPRPEQAARIIKFSKGAISWDDIYGFLLTRGKK